jgi:hypothetical protein
VPDCDYCGERFDDEDAYLDHLAAAHDGELKRIDQRRLEDHDADDGGLSRGPTLIAALVLLPLLAVGAFLLFSGGGGGGPPGNVTTGGNVTAEGNTIVSFAGTAPDGVETRRLPEQGREDVIGVVAAEPYSGSINHVPAGQLNYDPSNPPTAGPHTGRTASAGFYEQRVGFGPLVHSLEHGAVVVYYDPGRLTPEARESLRTFTQQHTGAWRSVIVVPHPGQPSAAYELTAWEHRLKLQEYDARAVRAFVAEYIGRGPENPVRPPAPDE